MQLKNIAYRLQYNTELKCKQGLNLKYFLAFITLTLSFNITAVDAEQAIDQIKSQVINKAINTTENYINTQANEIANNFGKGRTFITIKGIDSDKPSYSIDTIQPISKFDNDIQELTYIQGSLFNAENEGNRRNAINLGLGQRYLVEDERAIAGINLFLDYEGSSKHKRSSIGLEYQRSNFGLTTNKYYPLSDKVVIGDYTEEPLSGHDVNLTGQMPYAPWATIKGTHYYWDQITGDNISGNTLGVEIELSPSTSFEFGQEDSNTSEKKSYGILSINLPFDDNEKATNFTLDDKPFRASSIMNLTTLDMIKRSQQIKIEKLLNNIAPIFTSSATATVVENQTTAITLVATDEQTITYSITGTDSALFSVNSSSGEVTFASAPDYESPSDSDSNNVYTFTATATDSKGLATTQAVSITVTDTDDTDPVFTSSASANAAENQTAAITLVATDATTVTYSISDTDSALFSVNSGSGVVTFTSAPDYESPGDSGADNVYNFTATATDTAGNTTTQSVVITVTDVSETFASGDTFNGQTYLTVTSPDTGRVWLDRNLGATQVCTSSTDSACYGDLYQWGRDDDGHESRSSSTTTTLASTITPGTNIFILNSTTPYDWTTTDSTGVSRTSAWADGRSNDICPAGFSVPTEAELTADTTSATTIDVTNSTTAFSSFLKLPMAGYRHRGVGALYNVDSLGFYWSRGAGSNTGRNLYFNSSTADFAGYHRPNGFSVRCIQD